MSEPLLITQRAYDDAQAHPDTRTLDLLIAIAEINAAGVGLTHSQYVEQIRSMECPAANPLNEVTA